MSRTTRLKRQAGMMAAGVALTALLLCSVILILPANRSRGTKLLEKTLIQMEQLKNYDLIIIEKAPGYELSFQGRVENGDKLSGILPDYELEILSKDNLLFMKQQEAPEWDKAENLGLQGLAGFLITPLELLQERKDCFRDAVMGEAISLGEITCQTAYFTVTEPEKIVQRLFPQIDCTVIDEVIIGAAVAEPDCILKQLRILVEFGGNKNEKIERCYYLEQ